MKQRSVSWLAIAGVALALAVGVARAQAQGNASSDTLLELAAKGGPSVGFSFGVSPLHWDLIAPLGTPSGPTAAENRLLYEREARARALSLDFKLKWPTAEQLEPYVSLGPALVVDQRQDVIGVPSDPSLQLGAKAGAGFNWRLSKDATLFGSYDFTTKTTDGLSSLGAKTPATSPSTGYDLMYGVRFRY